MLSVRNFGGNNGPSLSIVMPNMYYDTGSTNGIPLDMRLFYGYYNVVNAPRTFIVASNYSPIEVSPTYNNLPE